jgi:hypothetical protein
VELWRRKFRKGKGLCQGYFSAVHQLSTKSQSSLILKSFLNAQEETVMKWMSFTNFSVAEYTMRPHNPPNRESEHQINRSFGYDQLKKVRVSREAVSGGKRATSSVAHRPPPSLKCLHCRRPAFRSSSATGVSCQRLSPICCIRGLRACAAQCSSENELTKPRVQAIS